jgi:hypothetical protein
MLRYTLSLVMAGLVGVAGPAAGQPAQTGTVQGDVRDATGGALPGVTVTITSQDRGFSRSTVTDTIGRYLFPAVPIGPYRVTASLQGFETSEATDNLVEVNRTTSVSFTMTIGALTDTVMVLGETPIVDATTVTQTTRVSRDEFEKLPVGRTYQALIAAAPGVVGAGNVNSLGALNGSNLFVIDAVDTTDPTTGTFGTNLNFEAIQEVNVMTSAVGAEYGRAQGAIVNVVTKSGTNRFEGSAKYIFSNDEWNAQNTTASEVTGASLEREKFDQVNPTYSFTGGGPLWKDRAWFFATYELTQNTSPQRQTVGQIPEDFQQVREDRFTNVRGTVQLAEGHTAWLKYYQSPSDGFVIDYWGPPPAAAEREALTAQSQTAKNWAAQWSGVLRHNWSMEAAVASYDSLITVTTFEASGRLANAPILNLAENKFYNGATFDGFVKRPRQQFNLASNWFLLAGGRSHDLKIGFDFQNVESGSLFQFPNAQWYIADHYDQATNTITHFQRRDYETGDSTSTGTHLALFVRDKFRVTPRLFIEAGVRFERQAGSSDLGADTVDTTSVAPRVSASYDLSGDGKRLVTGSYGRYYAGIIQGFSDAFAGVPQQANYDNYVWDGSGYVFSNSVRVGGSNFQANTDLSPSYMDEVTLGFQQQFGRSMGVAARLIARNWEDLIDDVRTFNPDGTINRQVVNYGPATRTFRGVTFSMEKRFSNNWNAQGSYTLSRTRGNHFGTTFTDLGDYIDAQCRTTADASIGNDGVIPCAEVQDGPNKLGRPAFDRPHNFKFNAAYVRPMGPVNLTLGALLDVISKTRFEKQRTVNVLRPGTVTNAGPTATYFYNERGADQLPGLFNVMDFSTELGWRIASTYQAAFRAEVFNLWDNQEKIASNNFTWCGSTNTAACATAVNNYGKAGARGSFVAPRNYRVSMIFRF